MSIEVIPPLPRGRYHKCDLPYESVGHQIKRTSYLPGTVLHCTECGEWWVAIDTPWSYDSLTTYKKVRWYHRDARKRIKEFLS